MVCDPLLPTLKPKKRPLVYCMWAFISWRLQNKPRSWFLHPGAFHEIMFVDVCCTSCTSSCIFIIYIYRNIYRNIYLQLIQCFSMQQSITSVHVPPWEWSPYVCVDSVDSFVVNFPCFLLDTKGEHQRIVTHVSTCSTWKMKNDKKRAKSWSNLFGSRMFVAFCSTLTPTWTVKFFRRFIRENLPCRSFWAAILMGHAQVTSCNLSMSDATGPVGWLAPSCWLTRAFLLADSGCLTRSPVGWHGLRPYRSSPCTVSFPLSWTFVTLGKCLLLAYAVACLSFAWVKETHKWIALKTS